MVRPRNSSIFSLLDKPIVVWDEPDQIRAAAERLWKRLEQIDRAPAYDPDRIYFRWEELERAASLFPQLSLKELEIGWTAPAELEAEASARPERSTSPPAHPKPSTATCRSPSPKRGRWWKPAIAWPSSRLRQAK